MIGTADNRDRVAPIDFSYKQGALETFYDFETVTDMFTNATINNNSISLMLLGNSQFDDLHESELESQLQRFLNDQDNRELLRLEDGETLNTKIYKLRENDKNDGRILNDYLLRLITCRPLEHDMTSKLLNKHRFAEYHSWNGSRYDLLLAISVKLALDAMSNQITPKLIRQLSNAIITFDGPIRHIFAYMENETAGLIKAQSFKQLYNLAIWSDGHIDWAAIARQTEGGEDSQLPPGLKKEMARFGLDIVIDESVASNESKIWTQEEREFLVDYDFNDVLGLKVVSENEMLRGELKTRDIVREMYPYTAARHTSMDKLNKYTPSERVPTAANLAGLTLIGPRRIKPEDWPSVQYTFPLPNRDRDKAQVEAEKNIVGYKPSDKIVDLLEHIKKTERYVPDKMVEFFSHFRGKNTQSRRDYNSAKYSEPITGTGIMNMPYVDLDNNPIDAYVKFSMGGAHGGIYAGLRLLSEDAIDNWIRSSAEVPNANKPTTDTLDSIHIDFSSYYPILVAKMRMFLTKEGIDRFSNIITYRFVQKDRATELKREGKTATAEYKQTQDLQMGLKFILNNATGAANTHNPYALLPLDNKTLAMRLIGNMMIWVLGQRLVDAGAFILATNTDGLFINNISVELAHEVLNEFKAEYGLDVEPEPMARYINRDTSTRIELEFNKNEVSGASGVLRHDDDLYFDRWSIGKNVGNPLCAIHAMLRYVEIKEDWLTAPYDKELMREQIQKIFDKTKAEHNTIPWFMIYAGTASRKLIVGDEYQQKISRIMFTHDGDPLSIVTSKMPPRIPLIEIWNSIMSGNETTFSDKLVFHKSSGEEYDAKFAYNDIITPDLQVSPKDLVLCAKVNDGVSDIYVPADYPHEEILQEVVDKRKLFAFANSGKIYDYASHKHLCYMYQGELIPIKLWFAGVVSGYPTTIGSVFNTRKSLREFDFDRLNLDDYLQWAEKILQQFKQTADLPVIGLKDCDDTVVIKPKSSRSRNKSNDALRDIYSNLSALLTA